MPPIARGLRVWIPQHELSQGCWCRPRIEEVAGDRVFQHRMVTLAPDSQPRAFATLLQGVPA